jgi:hypothetical protein
MRVMYPDYLSAGALLSNLQGPVGLDEDRPPWTYVGGKQENKVG